MASYKAKVLPLKPRATIGKPKTNLGYGPVKPQKPKAPTVGFKPTTTPAVPGSLAAQPMPFDPTYESTVANANRTYDNTMGQLAFNEQGVRQSYGFDDVSNPFSQAALLQKTYQENQARTLNSAGNNLYSSAYGNNVAQQRFGFDQSNDQLRANYAQALNDITAKRAQAVTDRDTASTGAYADAIARAPAPEDPGVPVGTPAKTSAAPKGWGSTTAPKEKTLGSKPVKKKPGLYARVTPVKAKVPVKYGKVTPKKKGR